MRGLVRVLSQKQLGSPGTSDLGWTRAGALSGGTGPRRYAQLMNTYGGTEESVTWVFACASLVASELASYPWHLEDLENAVIENADPTLTGLITEPNERMTYFDWIENTGLDLEMAGNSYWYLDQLNGLDQPARMVRLRPDKVRIVQADDGTITGYTYTVGGVQVPYRADEVLHFRYPNPLSDAYGMGTVEALIRTVSATLEQSDHVTGFFANGARLSGVLIVNGTLTDTEFERLQRQFQESYGGSGNAYKTLIAEQGMDFRPISADPGTAGVVEFLRMSKDEILSGFGVPAPLLGGLLENANYKMEEAQHIFSRTMRPKVRRVTERVSLDLVRRWDENWKFVVEQGQNDPASVRAARAKLMVGAGASWNEAREEMGLPPSDDPRADQIVDPRGFPIGIEAPRKTARLNGAKRVPNVAGLEAAALPPGDGWRPVQVPEYPSWAERISVVKQEDVDSDLLNDLLRHHAAVIRDGTDVFRGAMTSLFIGQRTRVMAALQQFRMPGDRANSGKLDRKQLDVNALWDDREENEELRAAYLPALDEVAEEAIGIPARIVGSELRWDIEHELVKDVRERLAAKVTRINDTTRGQIAEEVELGLSRGYSIPQIANGFPAEGYRGIMGVFDEATALRAETIARSETAMAYNGAAGAAYKDAGIEKVLVIDGTGDDACANANGSTWTLEEADNDPIAHPNCVRTFAPIL